VPDVFLDCFAPGNENDLIEIVAGEGIRERVLAQRRVRQWQQLQRVELPVETVSDGKYMQDFFGEFILLSCWDEFDF
jgi:hypothetical protein